MSSGKKKEVKKKKNRNLTLMYDLEPGSLFKKKIKLIEKIQSECVKDYSGNATNDHRIHA